MISLSRLTNICWSPGPEANVAIIGLEGVGKYTLLQRLSQTEIQLISWPPMNFPDIKKSKNYRWNMNLVQTYVVYDEKPAHKKWVADHFCDSDCIIFVIDDDKDSRPEACEWMNCYARGFKPSYGGNYFLKVREGTPWLILANKKTADSPLMTVAEIRRTMLLDRLDIDSEKGLVNLSHG
uniref:ADP-ribosylation factor-like protein 3 n=1 Tax=Talaromyces marneffei PM1 TaxID=1077442 RepID=A0A093Y6I0_TALMA